LLLHEEIINFFRADASPVNRPENPLQPVNGGLSEFGLVYRHNTQNISFPVFLSIYF